MACVDRGQFHAGPVAGVGGEHGRPAAGPGHQDGVAVGDGGRPVALVESQGAEQLLQRGDDADAGGRANGLPHRGVPGQRAGMRRRCPRPLPAQRADEDDHRLVAGHPAEGVDQRAAVLDPFEIQADDLGGRVGGEVVDELGDADVDGVADGDQFGEADASGRAGLDDVPGQAAALGDGADGSRLDRVVELPGLTPLGAVRPHAVRPDDPDAALPGRPEQFPLPAPDRPPRPRGSHR